MRIVLFILTLSFAHAQSLQYYFGNIHAHSAYSDGNQDSVSSNCSTPLEDYAYARNSMCFDFLGISDHNHNNAGMQLAHYSAGLAQADLANDEGNFVALYGMEWGVISQGGHVIIYGYDSLIGWETGNYDIYNHIHDYAGLFQKVNKKPGAFAYLAHPEDIDYDSLYYRPRNIQNDAAIAGMAIRSGPAFSTNTSYSNPSFYSYEDYYKRLLSLGYRLGAGLDHDNHNTTFGRTSFGRLAVIAPSLSRNEVLAAIKNMHCYATDDCNAELSFSLNGNLMGSEIHDPAAPTLQISLNDIDGESISYIRVYGGIPGSQILPTIVASVSGQNTLTFTDGLAMGDSFYYYVKIRQTDGNEIVSSPIWYVRETVLDAVELHFQVQSQGSYKYLSWSYPLNTHHFLLSINQGIPIQVFENSYTDTKTEGEKIRYTLSAIDENGKILKTERLEFKSPSISNIWHLEVSSLDNKLRFKVKTNIEAQVFHLCLYTPDGKLLGQTNFSAQSALDIPISNQGLYFYEVSSEDATSVSGKIWAN